MRRNSCYLALVLSSQIAIAEDWPQWQGPSRNATSSETGLLALCICCLAACAKFDVDKILA
jgi:hypothetical protein